MTKLPRWLRFLLAWYGVKEFALEGHWLAMHVAKSPKRCPHCGRWPLKYSVKADEIRCASGCSFRSEELDHLFCNPWRN